MNERVQQNDLGTDLQKILELNKVDPGNGTLFGVSRKAAPQKTNLTLIISSGGSGLAMIRAAKKIIDQKVTDDYRNYVKFLIIDSDSGAIEESKKEGFEVLNTSSPGAAFRFEGRQRPEFFRHFMPATYNVSIINMDGSSQDRMTGKMKIYDEAGGTTNDQLLFDKIRNLFERDWKAYADLPLNIMILSGLSGGNGSGSFLDIAAIARMACESRQQVSVYGYFMLPDTAERFADSDNAKKSLYGNGFAALKELETYMSMDFENGRSKAMFRSRRTNEYVTDHIHPLYDYPVLINGDYDKAASMIAETIVNTVMESKGFSQQSFYSNLLTVRSNVMSNMLNNGILKPDACPEDSHMYCGIGYAAASIPEKIVIPNVVSRVTRSFYQKTTSYTNNAQDIAPWCRGDRRLTRLQFEEQMRSFLNLGKSAVLKSDSLAQIVKGKLIQACPLPQNDIEITRENVNSFRYANYKAGFKIERTINEGISVFVKSLNDLFVQMKERTQTIMRDYGPRVVECLYDGRGNLNPDGTPEIYEDICLRKQLEEAYALLMRYASNPIPNPGELPSRGIIGSFLYKKELTEWQGKAAKAATSEIYGGVCKKMLGSNGGWETELIFKIRAFMDECSRFAQVIEKLMDYYQGQGRSLDTGKFQDFAIEKGDINGINLCNSVELYDWVVNSVEKKVNGIDISLAKDKLVESFFKKPADWISSESGKARRIFDDVMSEICGVGIHSNDQNSLRLSINDYFAEVLQNVPETEQAAHIDATISRIMGELKTASKPMIKTIGNEQAPINTVIIVPENLTTGAFGQMIHQSFAKHLSQSDTVVSSAGVDAIICYQASVANALSNLQDLDLWEKGYEETADDTIHLNNPEYVSLHMKDGMPQYKELTLTQTSHELGDSYTAGDPSMDIIAGTGLSWLNHETINLRRYGNDFSGDQNTIEGRYRKNVFNPIIEKALEWHIIECEEVNPKVYKYWMNVIPKDWNKLSAKGYKGRTKEGLVARGRELFDFLADQNPGSNATYRKQIMLENSPAFGVNGFDYNPVLQYERWSDQKIQDTHRIYLKRILRKANGLFLELRDTMYRYQALESELSAAEQTTVAGNRVKVFTELLTSGVIRTNEDESEWKIIVGFGRSGANEEELLYFSRKSIIQMNDREKLLNKGGLRLVLVYDRYQQMLQREDLSEQTLMGAKDGLIASFKSDAEFDRFLDETLASCNRMLDRYREIVGSSREPDAEILDYLGLEEDEESFDYTAGIVQLYESLEASVAALNG